MTGPGAAGTGPRRTAEQQPTKDALAVLRAMPKVELHLHLDCCLSYAAAAKLSPGLTRGQYERDFTGPDRVNGLTDFLSRTLNHVALLQTRDGLVTCVEDLAGQLERDNVIYAELRFAPAQHTRLGLDAGEVVQIVADAIEALRGSSPVTMKLLLCSLWHLPRAHRDPHPAPPDRRARRNDPRPRNAPQHRLRAAHHRGEHHLAAPHPPAHRRAPHTARAPGRRPLRQPFLDRRVADLEAQIAEHIIQAT